MVFQHFSLFDELTVAENIAVALPEEWTLDGVRKRLGDISRNYGLALDADRAVWTLSAGERQRIEIVRCLLQGPRLLILDEPTSVLTPQEAEHLFVTLDKLSAEGCVDPLHLAQARRGPPSLCRPPPSCGQAGRSRPLIHASQSASEIAALMVGNEVGEVRSTARTGPAQKCCRSTISPLRRRSLHGISLSRINLVAHAGEVVGIAGIAGNGQSELFAALSGERLGELRQRDRDRRAVPAEPPASTRDAGSARPSCRRNGSATPLLRRIA